MGRLLSLCRLPKIDGDSLTKMDP